VQSTPPAIPSFQHLHSSAVDPRQRGAVMQAWYEYLAQEHSGPGWLFMNFGYADTGASAGRAANPIGTSAALYRRLATGLEPRGRRILEVGCGRGGGAVTLMKWFRPASLHAIDLSEQAIALCRRLYSLPGLVFETGSAEALPYPDASFDGVLNLESSHCYPDFDRFVAEVHRVLAPGGRFAIADGRGVDMIPAWRERLQHTGLRLLEAHDITANVVRSLELTSAFKVEFAEQHVPAEHRAQFCEFGGIVGSWYYESLRRGEHQYWQFLLQK
jgi:SAM-dependent methyltransferase